MINSLLALLGTIGGLIFFGVLGLIIGPLIIAYLNIIYSWKFTRIRDCLG